MHKEGHSGTMLLLYAPFAFFLAYFGAYAYLITGFVLLASMPMVPDIDMKLPIKHRGITHTVWFAVFLGIINVLLVSGATYYFYGSFSMNWFYPVVVFAFFIGNMWVYGHLIGDMVTHMGLKPLYPVDNSKVRIEFKWLRLPTSASSSFANMIMLTIGSVLFFAAVGCGLYLRYNGISF
jgi:inner membrane protein